ncbi:MAG: NUDIX domain-containing protein [Bacillota bacterium]|nr:NUDIX domain-containing protein [Bacillota bacterium]
MESWELLDYKREKTGEYMERGAQMPPHRKHLVVHICIFNTRGEMLIQQRQPFKKGWSDLWDFTVGGSAVAGDTSQQCAQRELEEELGIKHSFEGVCPHLTLSADRVFDDIYIVEKDIDLESLTLQKEEVQAVKWASREEIDALLDAGKFIQYHRSLIDLLFYFKDCRSPFTSKDTTIPTKMG